MPRFSQQVLSALSNPQAGMLTGQAIANVGGRLAQIPANIRAEKERQRLLEEQALRRQAGQLAVSSIGAGDASGAIGAAEELARLGDPNAAMDVLGASQDIRAQADAQRKLDARKSAMATRAESLGLTEVAKSIRQAPDNDALNTIAKDLRQVEVSRLPSQTPAVRRSLASAAGILPSQFAALNINKISDSEFDALISGQKGDVKAWQNTSGEIKTYRENDFGMVFDTEQNKWVEPSELGLQQAPPSVQKVENIASSMGPELAKAGVQAFSELHTKASDAQIMINNIEDSLPLLDTAITGLGADARLFLGRVAVFLGDDPSSVVDTELYVAQAAPRVAAQIKALGSGTGLSDADREFTEKAVGGNIAMNAESLRRLLNILKNSSKGTIDQFYKVKSSIRNSLSSGDKNGVDFFQLPAATTTTKTANWSDL